MHLSSKSVILDLLSATPTRTLPVDALVRGALVLGHSEGSVRVCLTRLVAAHLVTSSIRGEYALGKAATPVHCLIQQWREAAQPQAPWRGAWLGLHALQPKQRKLRPRHHRAIDLFGFKELRGDLFIRPANLHLPSDVLISKLTALGLSEDAMIFTLNDLSDEVEQRARLLWDVESITAEYKTHRVRLQEVTTSLSKLDTAAAARATFLAGRACIRCLTLDPLLPDEMMSAKPRIALVQEMMRFDALGKALWQEILDVDVEQVPAWAGVMA